MNKEEAIKIIRHMTYLSAHVVEDGVEAFEFIEQLLSKPSLPSNLAEAAVQAHIKLEEGEGLSFLNIFEAGAEWMAEQAEKDLALTWTDIKTLINDSPTLLSKDEDSPGRGSQEYYEEILKRFNNQKQKEL